MRDKYFMAWKLLKIRGHYNSVGADTNVNN